MGAQSVGRQIKNSSMGMGNIMIFTVARLFTLSSSSAAVTSMGAAVTTGLTFIITIQLTTGDGGTHKHTHHPGKVIRSKSLAKQGMRHKKF